ncbi:hypothetical protein BK816_03935 [Boudabousia tangfeifanii]|uniref:DNA primase n=1 Tax=Boudabousia tangfeifanii TaxID=1912795 RepID=A0A1D9MJU0_9ACTO|nr:hypothetical protein [Boudabousia tangfeifanii]AOZ72552.1 hypothetical protein BK816_03935 [Boudabousia tangfeifanii]
MENIDSRQALEALVNALEAHYECASHAADQDKLEAAEIELRDAFFTYDDLLFTEFDTELPFEMLEDVDEDVDYVLLDEDGDETTVIFGYVDEDDDDDYEVEELDDEDFDDEYDDDDDYDDEDDDED